MSCLSREHLGVIAMLKMQRLCQIASQQIYTAFIYIFGWGHCRTHCTVDLSIMQIKSVNQVRTDPQRAFHIIVWFHYVSMLSVSAVGSSLGFGKGYDVFVCMWCIVFVFISLASERRASRIPKMAPVHLDISFTNSFARGGEWASILHFRRLQENI